MSVLKKRERNLFSYWDYDLFEDGSLRLNNLFGIDEQHWRGAKTPPANITENRAEYRLDISAPGLTRDDFKVEVDNRTLVISCEKQEELKENDKRDAFSYSSFSRTFQLPEQVAEDKIKASYENGMLRVSIPKKETTATQATKDINRT